MEMGIQKEHGDWAEDQAEAFLRQKGLEVLERNWRYKRAEVDIIAREGDILVFVEVKMKSGVSFGRPEEVVDTRKQQLLIDAAMAYMRSVGHEWEIRFDIIGIVGGPTTDFTLTHIRDAFFPGIGYGGV